MESDDIMRFRCLFEQMARGQRMPPEKIHGRKPPAAFRLQLQQLHSPFAARHNETIRGAQRLARRAGLGLIAIKVDHRLAQRRPRRNDRGADPTKA